MKKSPVIVVVIALFTIINSFAQVQSSGNWTAIGTSNLSIVTDDANNGDGVGDGAIYVDGQDTSATQGIAHAFNGTMTLGETITINTYTYNRNASYVKFTVGLYNVQSGTALVVSPEVTINGTGSNPSPELTTLNYTAVASDVGDQLELRYYRTSALDTYRNFAIDNVRLNGTYISTSLSQTCPFTLTPDLPLVASNSSIDAEIVSIVDQFSDDYLGTSAPSASALASAESSYASLNITAGGGSISGNTLNSFSDVSFLRTFAQHLKFNPGDTNIATKANNTVWWVGKQFCQAVLARDNTMYSYSNFARSTVLLVDFLDSDVKDLFGYTLYVHSEEFAHFWEPNYDSTYQELNGAINTDLIYNVVDAMLGYALWYDTQDERYRYMRGYKRFMERFFSYTEGTTDGIKKDGSGFHHWTAYNNYLYAYQTAVDVIYYLGDSQFQVSSENYSVFRDAVYYQYMQANDYGVQPLSSAGRNPQNRSRQFSQESLRRMALTGGSILGLSTADPVFASLYNRIYGVEAEFNYNEVAPQEKGFFEFNHAHASAYKKDGVTLFNKGFSDNMWGSEIYTTRNRYGRYQSYGALEVLYEGNKETGNGFDESTWNWNFNPGTTTIVLPWSDLHAERGRIDELQQNRFVGALAMKKTNKALLRDNQGQYGIFAMDFQEQEGLGWGATHSGNTHNSTFTFKKSTFYFDDIVVCLGSNISNNDNTNTTVTTLFQRLDNKGVGVYVNGTSYTSNGTTTFSGSSNNWMMSNYNTGFYAVSGNPTLTLKKETQQVPYYNQVWPVDYSGNDTASYFTGYLDHGTNPANDTYEYVLLPNTTVSNMQTLDTQIQGGSKPYTVHQQNGNAHVVSYPSRNLFGYAFFGAVTGMSYDFVTDANAEGLLMTEYNMEDQTLLMALSNPDLGFSSRSYSKSVSVAKQITLQGEWHLISYNDNVSIVSASALETVVEFTTVDGKSYEILLKQGAQPCTGLTSVFKDGSWSNGVPNATQRAVIQTDYDTSVDGDIIACSCEIEAEANLIVTPTNYIDVQYDLIIEGTLEVRHEGSIVQRDANGVAKNSGEITVTKVTPNLDSTGFMILGNPMTETSRESTYSNAALVWDFVTSNFIPDSDVSTTSPGAENFADDNNDVWQPKNGVFEVTSGYLVNPNVIGSGGGIATIHYKEGTLNNGDLSKNTVFNTSRDDSPNLAGNPYASAIDCNLLIQNNASVDALYFWEHLTEPSAGYPGPRPKNYTMDDISMYTLSGGVAAPNGGIAPTRWMPSGQGFGYKALNATPLTFTNAMRVTGPNTGYRSSEAEMNSIRLQLKSLDESIQSTMLLSFTEDATDAYDVNYEAKRLATPVSIYSVMDSGKQLAIQGLSAFRDSYEIAVGVSSLITEQIPFTISIKNIEGGAIDENNVFLKDHLTGSFVNLRDTPYTFQLENGEQVDRFTLYFTDQEELGSSSQIESFAVVYPNPASDLVYVQATSIIEHITLLDIQGRKVMDVVNQSSMKTTVDLSTLNDAMYIMIVTTKEGRFVEKIFKM